MPPSVQFNAGIHNRTDLSLFQIQSFPERQKQKQNKNRVQTHSQFTHQHHQSPISNFSRENYNFHSLFSLRFPENIVFTTLYFGTAKLQFNPSSFSRIPNASTSGWRMSSPCSSCGCLLAFLDLSSNPPQSPVQF